MSILYNNNSAIGRLFQYFSAYFTSATRPTRTLLTWLLIGMLVLEGMPSIRWLHRHFLSQVYPKSLNCYYRACAVAKLDENVFLTTTAKLALELIPDTLRNKPVFLSTDDTIVVKFGKHFEQVSILHDHALYTGKLYVIGHRRVLTNIFGDKPVNAYVTESTSGSRRLFFCTADPAEIHMSCAWQEKSTLKDV